MKTDESGGRGILSNQQEARIAKERRECPLRGGTPNAGEVPIGQILCEFQAFAAKSWQKRPAQRRSWMEQVALIRKRGNYGGEAVDCRG